MSLQKSYEIVDAVVAQGTVALTYDQRLLRRKKLTTTGGEGFYVDLPKTVSVRAGQGFLLDDGRIIAIEAATEDLLSVTGPDMLRYAWHIGNRHTPCALAADQLVIQRDPVIKAMLIQLGAEVADIYAAFTPEGGAYGHGRTMGHDHGNARGQSHDPDHNYDHNHNHGSVHAHPHEADHAHAHAQGHEPHD
jgi:urease accessory protein